MIIPEPHWKKRPLDAVKLLWNNGADIGAATTSSSSSALVAAARGGYLDTVLLDRRANAHTRLTNLVCQMALRAAAGGGYLDVVKVLLNNWTDVDEK